jgi:mannose-1-phosphate guanylyltransferase
MLYATIMAGGSGTRFWPASRRGRPKQFLRLTGETSMLQATMARLGGLVPLENTLVLTNEQLVAETRQQLPSLPEPAIIGEPCKRDTAPCIALAAAMIQLRNSEATMLVMPADHAIRNVRALHDDVRLGLELLDQDPQRLVTFGVEPHYPAEVFGYIERGAPIRERAWRVARFREKPDRETAVRFLNEGRFFWNTGIFLWRARTIVDALRELEPSIMDPVARIASAAGTSRFDEVFRHEFESIPGKSIDYAVLEHHDNVCVVTAGFDWDDVGNWTSLPRLAGTDANGNSVRGKHLGVDSRNCIVYSGQDHLVVTLGLDGCIVVHTPDATLVADLEDEAGVRKVVAELESRGMEEYL